MTGRVTIEVTPEADCVAVCLDYQNIQFEADEVLATLPQGVAGGPRLVVRHPGLQAQDSLGPIPLTQREEAWSGAGEAETRWVGGRRSIGSVRVQYSFECDQNHSLSPSLSPMFPIRPNGGFSANGQTFLALAASNKLVDWTMTWVDEGGGASRLVSSHGVSPLELRTRPLQSATYAHYMAGDVNEYRAESGVVVYSLTPVSLDARILADRVGALSAAMACALAETPRSYSVFLRRGVGTGIKGCAVPGGFVLAVGETGTPMEMTALAFGLLNHEVVHEWLWVDGSFAETAWFNEGLAEYYARVAAVGAGLALQAEASAQFDSALQWSLAGPHAGLTINQLMTRYWLDAAVRRTTYARGLSYFILLDRALKAAESGVRLSDLVLRLRTRIRAGGQVGLGEWRSWCESSLGLEAAGLEGIVITGELASEGGAVTAREVAGPDLRLPTVNAATISCCVVNE